LLPAGQQRPDERRPEPAIGAQSCPSGSCQFVSTARGIATAAQQPCVLTHVQRVMQDRLARGLATQGGNASSGAPMAECAAVDRIENGELGGSERIRGFHAPSVRALVGLSE
jgi:hypothetical protein